MSGKVQSSDLELGVWLAGLMASELQYAKVRAPVQPHTSHAPFRAFGFDSIWEDMSHLAKSNLPGAWSASRTHFSIRITIQPRLISVKSCTLATVLQPVAMDCTRILKCTLLSVPFIALDTEGNNAVDLSWLPNFQP